MRATLQTSLHHWSPDVCTGIYQAFLTLVAACFYFSGFVPLMRWVRRRGRHVVILNYHRAATGDLRAHLCYLRRHYRIMPLDGALEELYAPTPTLRPMATVIAVRLW